MICDYQTDKVYLAEGIKGYPKVAERLLFALYSEGIKGSPETTDGTSRMSGFPSRTIFTAVQLRKAELTSI